MTNDARRNQHIEEITRWCRQRQLLRDDWVAAAELGDLPDLRRQDLLVLSLLDNIAEYCRRNHPRPREVVVAVLIIDTLLSNNKHGCNTLSAERMAKLLNCNEKTVRLAREKLVEQEIMQRLKSEGIPHRLWPVTNRNFVGLPLACWLDATSPPPAPRGRPRARANEENPGRDVSEVFPPNFGADDPGFFKNPGHDASDVIGKTPDTMRPTFPENPGHEESGVTDDDDRSDDDIGPTKNPGSQSPCRSGDRERTAASQLPPQQLAAHRGLAGLWVGEDVDAAKAEQSLNHSICQAEKSFPRDVVLAAVGDALDKMRDPMLEPTSRTLRAFTNYFTKALRTAAAQHASAKRNAVRGRPKVAPAQLKPAARISRPTDNWWHNPDVVKRVTPEEWRQAIAEYANGTWPVELLGPRPCDPGCVIPKPIIDELQLPAKDSSGRGAQEHRP